MSHHLIIGLKGSSGEGEQARLTRSPATTPTASLLHHLPGQLVYEVRTVRGDDPSGQVGDSNDVDHVCASVYAQPFSFVGRHCSHYNGCLCT